MRKILLNKPDLLWGACLLGLILLGQWQRLSFGEINFYLHDLVVVGWLVDLWRRQHRPLVIRAREQAGQLTRTAKLTLSLLVATVVMGWMINLEWSAGLWALTGLKWPLLYLGRIGAYLCLAWAIVIIKPFTANQLRAATSVTVLVTLLIGIGHFIISPDMRWLAIYGWDDHYFRLVGTQLDPGFAGLILVFGFWWALTNARSNQRLFWLGAALATLLAITLTWSRASYLSLVASITWAAILSPSFIKRWGSEWGKGRLILALMAIIFISLIAFIPRPSGEGGKLARTSTVNARIEAGTTQLSSFKGSDWILGQGFLMINKAKISENYERPNHAKLPDNILITLGTGIGAIGLALLVTLVWQSRKIIQRLISNYPLSATLMVAILVHSQFNNSLLQPFVGFFWLLILIAEKEMVSKRTQL